MIRTNNKIVILIIFFSFFTCKEKSIIETQLESLGMNQTDFLKIDTTYYESNVIENLRFINSNSEYIDVEFYESGKKKSFIPVKYTQVHGECTDWFENGNIKWKRYYNKGNSIKTYTTYSENGNLTLVNDIALNSYTHFYKNGEVRVKFSDSLYVDYYYNGQTKSSFIKQADKHSRVNYINENGGVVFSGISDSELVLFKNDSLFTGEIITKFLNNEISFSQKYINGIPEGKCFGKYGNGNLEFETEFEKGKEIGIQKRYHLNGKLKSTKDFKTKEYKEWDENGILVE